VRIAYAGAPGAFAHEACLEFAAGWQPVAVGSFAAVAEAVAAGEVELGMLPVANSRAGAVEEALAAIVEAGLAVREERALPVRMHLLARPGTALREVKVAVSHRVALAQCATTLQRLGIAGEAAPNTAVGARDLSGAGRAALASEAAARAYGLHILLRDLQDDPENATTFAIVERPIPRR
jgi:prephenate dehydratase